MLIQRLRTIDAAQVLALRRAVEQANPGPLGTAKERALATNVEEVDRLLSRQDGATFGVFAEGVLVGAAYVAPASLSSTWFAVSAVTVHPDCRGRGIGRALVEACIAHAAAAAAEGVTLDVNFPNPAAKALYGRLGFEVWATGASYSTERSR